MPGGDRTGPTGNGPMTGRAAGYCTGYGDADFDKSGFGFFGPGRMFGGRGGSMGRGGFRNRRRNFYQDPVFFGRRQTLSPEQETEGLKSRAKTLKATLDLIEERIQDLENSKPEEN